MLPPPSRWPFSAFALIAANLVPLVGVLTNHWSVFLVLLLYWSENVVVGAFNVLRMAYADPQVPVMWFAKLFFIPFFTVHYGIFTLVHGMFVVTLFGGHQYDRANLFSVSGMLHVVRTAGIGYAVAFLVVSHGFSFIHNYIASGEYLRVDLKGLMTQPYARIVVLHITTLIGGALATAAGAPLMAVVVLVLLKTAVDLQAHLAERTRLAAAAALPDSVLS
ncbi:MAG TPA: DUF6498-containing protein [Gemmatimonadales bacterium]